MEIEVGAYQWGSAVEPFVQTAPSSNRVVIVRP
jgi:hypothetical protein